MIRMAPSNEEYNVDDQNATRRSISSVVKKLDAADINAANANKLAITNAAVAKAAADAAAAAAVAADAAAAAAQHTADGVVTSAEATRVIVDLGLDPTTGRLTSGVDPGADIAGLVAGYVGKAQHGVFLDSFETLPVDWNNRAGAVSLAQGTDGVTGGKSVKATGTAWLAFPYNIAFDPSKLYRIRTRVKQNSVGTTGTPIFYCGVEGIASDGVTLVNVVGNNAGSTQHYVCANNVAVPGGWTEYTGWFKGSGVPSLATTPLAPSPLYPTARYIRPMFILNYGSSNAVSELDYIAIDVLDEDAITRAYTALTHDGDLSRGAAGSVAIETLAGAVGADPLNLIANGGGQSGALGAAPSWTGGAGNALLVSAGAAKFGDRSLLLDNTAGAVDSNSYQDFNVTDGDVYRASGWLRPYLLQQGTGKGIALSLGQIGITLSVLDRIGSDFGLGGPVAGVLGGAGATVNTDFQFCSVTVKVAGSGTLRFYLSCGYAGTASGAGFFDGVRLEKVGPNVAIGGSRAINALNTDNRLVTGVISGATVGGIDAGTLSRAQGSGVFTEIWADRSLADWAVVNGSAPAAISAVPWAYTAPSYGGNALYARGPVWYAYQRNIPYDPNKLYRMRVKVAVAGYGGGAPAQVYLGMACVMRDGVTLKSAVGGNSYSASYYLAAAGATPGFTGMASWTVYEGWFKGVGGTDNSPKPNPTSPSVLADGTAFIRPLMILNYGGTPAADMYVDSVELTEYDDAASARVYNAISSTNQLIDLSRMPMTAIGGMPARFYQTGTYTPLTTPMTSFGASISISAFDAYFGGSVVHYNAAAAGGYSTPGGTVNYVYGLDPLYAGGSPAWYAHYDPRVVAQQPGLIYLGKITLTDAAGGTGTACVAPQTKILVDNSEQRFAGDIAVGDCLLTQHEVTRLWGRHKVSHVSVHDADRWCLVLNDGRKLVATPNHRVYVEENGWTQLDKLSHGDLLDGLYPGIVDKCYPLDNGPVIKLTVEDAHTYQSAGILSHNLKPL